MINVGMIGFGLSGQVLHAPLILAAGMSITAVVTRRIEELRNVLPGADAAVSETALLARNDVDLVVIVTPNHLHVPQALAALRAGKHVVIDKPLSTQLAEADQLIEVAGAHQRRLAVFQNRRWDSDFLTIEQLIADDKLGDIVSFSARWDRYCPQVTDRWREDTIPGAGVLFDLGSHLLDQAFCLFGQPEWLQADVFTQRHGALVDDGFELLMGKGRLRISLGVSSLAAENRTRYRILGERASFTTSGIDPQEASLRAGISPLTGEFGIEVPQEYGVVTHGDGHREVVPSVAGRWLTFCEQMRASIESPRSGCEPVPATEARANIALIEAARVSCAQGRRIWF